MLVLSSTGERRRVIIILIIFNFNLKFKFFLLNVIYVLIGCFILNSDVTAHFITTHISLLFFSEKTKKKLPQYFIVAKHFAVSEFQIKSMKISTGCT